jgi:DNA uptake protein ComE-like DNA-binding protein
MSYYLNNPDYSGSSLDWRRKLATMTHRKLQSHDINRVEPWLLEALPGTGEVLAQGIVGYCRKNDHFRRIEDLLKVATSAPRYLKR